MGAVTQYWLATVADGPERARRTPWVVLWLVLADVAVVSVLVALPMWIITECGGSGWWSLAWLACAALVMALWGVDAVAYTVGLTSDQRARYRRRRDTPASSPSESDGNG